MCHEKSKRGSAKLSWEQSCAMCVDEALGCEGFGCG